MNYIRILLISAILCIANNPVKAQTGFELKSGKGFFGDVLQLVSPGFGWDDDDLSSNPEVYGKLLKGSMTWFEVSYKMQTGYNVALFVGSGYTWQYHNDYLGFFWDEKYHYVYNMYSFTVLRGFNAGRHHFSPGAGLSYRSARETYIDYDIKYENGDVLFSYPGVINMNFQDFGIELKFDYQYSITNNLSLGLRLMANVTLAIGFENVMVSPFISIRL